MKSDSIAFGVAGIVFGLIAGWVIGSQQAGLKPPVQQPAQQQAQSNQPSSPAPAAVDEAKVTAFKNIAEKDPKNAESRIQLGNLYFDADRYQDAIPWYEQALKLAPRDVNVITDLGVAYYSVNEPDKALDQFTKSLK